LLVTDISGFGRYRATSAQEEVRARHYRILEVCLQESGIEPADCYWEDRGDGAIIAIPARHHPLHTIHPFLETLRYQLREDNLALGKEQRVRLRVAMHVGEVDHDGRGLTGVAVVLASRLVNAQSFKDKFRESGAALAFITSGEVYESVIRRAGRDIDPDDFEQVLVTEKETKTTAWMLLRGKADPRAPGDPPRDLCPYPGLAPFGPDHAEWFFGRERAIAEVLERLKEQLHKPGPLIVVGASGVGKSSLLRAGLLHRLERGKLGVRGSADWTRVWFRPTHDPVGELAAHLAEAGVGAEPPTGANPAVIVVDQFEEAFTLCADEHRRREFIQRLCGLAAVRPGGVPRALVVIGLRAEFFDRCTAYPELQGPLRAPVPLAPMTVGELQEAITKPADAVGFKIEPDLVKVLLHDLDIPEEPGGIQGGAHDSGALPLLAHALRETWQVGGGHGLTLEGYHTIGTIRRAIAQTADQVYERLDADEQQIARWLLLRMTKISEDTQTRRRADRARLVAESPDGGAAEAVLEELADARLVTLGETTAEIAHDVLLRAWPRLRKWIDEDRAGLVIQQRLAEDADTWHQEGKDPSGLYRGHRLAEARAWARDERHDADLTPLAREFLAGSEAAELRERRAAHRRTRVRRLVVIVLACLLVIAVVSTVVAVLGLRTATGQRYEALSRQVAGKADALLRSRPALALPLSVQAHRIRKTNEARDSLLSTQANYFAARLPTRSPANDVAFGTNGRTIAVAAHSGVDTWDAATRSHLHTALGGGPFYGVASSPGGRVLAIAGSDGGVTLWDDRDRRPRTLPPGPTHRGPANDVAFSRDGRLLAGAGPQGAVRLWDVRTRRLSAELVDDFGPVEAVAFSRDGRTLASVGADTRVALWDIASRDLVARLKGHVGPVRAVAFSPDGRVLASGGDDGSVRMWDAETRAPLGSSLIGHIGPVRAVAFSPNGRVLASGGDDASVRLWDVDSRSLLTPLSGPAGAVAAVSFSPDGGALASANADASVGFWSLGGLGLGGPGLLRAVTVRPDGNALLATVGADRVIRLWDVRTGRHLAVLRRRGVDRTRSAINALAFDRDGRLLAAADGDGITFWRLSAGAEPVARREAELRAKDADKVTAVAVSPDGDAVAGAGDKTLTVWDVDSRRVTASVTPHPSRINVVAFSPDGHTVATGSDDRTVSLTQVPDAPGGTVPGTSSDCSGHLGPVQALAFSSRGKLLASAGADHTVKLWIPKPCKLIHTFTGHTQAVWAVAFSPDGGRLASAGQDEFVNVWEVTGERVASLRYRSGVSALTFGRTDELVISADQDGRPVRWDTDADRMIGRICGPRPPLPPDWGQHVPGELAPPC
jgi:WD40 repeat protein